MLLIALTNFVDVFNGRTPPAMHSPFFFRASEAPKKVGGGIRPIAMGHTLQHLAAKCLCSRVLLSVGVSSLPLWLGYGTPWGTEAAAHAT